MEPAPSIQHDLESLLVADGLNLTNLSATVEDRILQNCKRTLLSELGTMAAADDLGYKPSGDMSYFVLGETQYRFAITEASDSSSRLVISILNVLNLKSDPATALSGVEFESCGRYSSLSIIASESCGKYAAHLLSQTEKIFIEGYRWLEETAKILLKDLLRETGEDLYRAVRMRLPEAVWKNVLLYVIGDKVGTYVIDPTVRNLTMARFKQRKFDVDVSPLEQQIALETDLLPKDLTFSWESVLQKTVIQNKHVSVKYSVEEFPRLFIAEESSLDYDVDKGFAIIPLVFSERGASLVAVCPAQLKDLVDLESAEISHECKTLLENRSSALHRFIRRTRALVSMEEHGGVLEIMARLVAIVIRPF
jgi:hypothetical protein